MYTKLALFLLSIVLISCASDVIYDETLKADNPWSYQQKLSFQYQVPDTTQPYDLHLKIRYSDTFAFENVYLKMTTYFPGGDSVASPLSLELADNQGSWQGKCNDGTCETDILLLEKAYFKFSGIHKLTMEQYSRQPELSGIESIRLLVKRHKKS